MTSRTDAAVTRRVVGARLMVSTAVLGGALALAGLGAVGDLGDSGAQPGRLGGEPVTVELAEAVGTR